MNKRGTTTLEVLAWIVGASVGTVVWAYSTFMSKDSAAIMRENRDREISEIRTDLREMKGDIKELLKRTE